MHQSLSDGSWQFTVWNHYGGNDGKDPSSQRWCSRCLCSLEQLLHGPLTWYLQTAPLCQDLHAINLLSVTTSEGVENKRKIIPPFELGHGRLFFNPGNILISIEEEQLLLCWVEKPWSWTCSVNKNSKTLVVLRLRKTMLGPFETIRVCSELEILSDKFQREEIFLSPSSSPETYCKKKRAHKPLSLGMYQPSINIALHRMVVGRSAHFKIQRLTSSAPALIPLSFFKPLEPLVWSLLALISSCIERVWRELCKGKAWIESYAPISNLAHCKAIPGNWGNVPGLSFLPLARN